MSAEDTNNRKAEETEVSTAGKDEKTEDTETESGNTERKPEDTETESGKAERKPDPRTGKKKTGSGKRKKAPPPKKRRKRTLGQRVAALLIKIGVVAAVIWILINWVGGVFICHTSDMYPSLRDGDLVITYRLGEYKNGDIVAYDYNGQIFFGRVIGEPGDEIFLDEAGTFTLNGMTPYETIYYTTQLRDSDSMSFPYTVKEGEYFVLCDAREQGIDSRNFGPVTDLKGRVVLQIRRRGF
jgi:signal peptidase I